MTKSFNFPFSGLAIQRPFQRVFFKNHFNIFYIKHHMLMYSITVAKNPGSARKWNKWPWVQALCVRKGTRSQERDPSRWAHALQLTSQPPLHPVAFGFLLTRRTQRAASGHQRDGWQLVSKDLEDNSIFPFFILSFLV